MRLLLAGRHRQSPNRAYADYHQGGSVVACDRDTYHLRRAGHLPNPLGSNPFREKTHWPDSVAEPVRGSWRTKSVRQTTGKADRSRLHRNLGRGRRGVAAGIGDLNYRSSAALTHTNTE